MGWTEMGQDLGLSWARLDCAIPESCLHRDELGRILIFEWAGLHCKEVEQVGSEELR